MRNERQIVAYLTELADVLRQLGISQPLHVLVWGGACMIIWKKRQFTEDIDFAMIQVPVSIPSRGHFKVTIMPDEIANQHSGIPYADEVRHLTHNEILLAVKGGSEERGPRVISSTWSRKTKGKGAYEKSGKRVKTLKRCPARPA